MKNVIDVSLLKGKMAEKGFTQKKLAETIGITSKTLHDHIENQCFSSDEIYCICIALGISSPDPIFFAKLGA